MQYKNTKTGVIINSPCALRGGDWVQLGHEKYPIDPVVEDQEIFEQDDTAETLQEVADSTVTVEEAPAPPQNVDQDEAGDAPKEITKAQIMQELDAFGIKYNPQAKKQKLYDLMMSQGA